MQLQHALSKNRIASALGSVGARYFSSVPKRIMFGDAGRAAMLRGVHVLTKAVASTLGPLGRNVIIQTHALPRITKDGVSVAKSISLPDPFENLGAQLIQSVASRTNAAAGDGTTTATVLARAIFTEGLRCIASGTNPARLREGIQLAVAHVVEYLRAHATPVTTPKQTQQVATISANGDVQIGRLIADAVERVGRNGVVAVQNGKATVDELVVTHGMQIDRGFVSAHFINEPQNARVFLENALVLLSANKLSQARDVLPALEQSVVQRKPLVVVAEDVDGDALAALVLNSFRGHVPGVAIRAAGFGDSKTAQLRDLAVLTNAAVFGDTPGIDIEKLDASHLGNIASVTSNKNESVFVQKNKSSKVQTRVEELQILMKRTKSDYEREQLAERIARLSGGVALILVGGHSEAEVSERKDRLDDALHATRAAIDEGVVPGGGSALIKTVSGLKKLSEQQSDRDTQLGINIIIQAVQAPATSMVDNAGAQGAVVVGELLRHGEDFTYGYDVVGQRYVNMLEAGIVDPLKVVRCAIMDAAAVGGLLSTAEAFVVDDIDDKKKSL